MREARLANEVINCIEKVCSKLVLLLTINCLSNDYYCQGIGSLQKYGARLGTVVFASFLFSDFKFYHCRFINKLQNCFRIKKICLKNSVSSYLMLMVPRQCPGFVV